MLRKIFGPNRDEVTMGVEKTTKRRNLFYGKNKSVPLQSWSGPEGSRKLRFPDFVTVAQDGGKVVSLTHWPPYPQEKLLVLIYIRG